MSLPGSGTAGATRLFAINGIPVLFSSSFLFLLLFWGMQGGAYALVHVVTMTVSVLVHEFGHALVAQRYRLRPSVVLHGLGGYCAHAPPAKRNHGLAVSVAGPAAGLAVGLAAWGLTFVVPSSPLIDVVLRDMMWLGIFWSAVNMLPILPLDGGHIALNLAERRRSISRPSLLLRAVSIGTAVIAATALQRFAGGTGVVLLAYLAAVNAWELRWVSNFLDRQQVPRWWPATAALVIGIALTMLPSLFAPVEAWVALPGPAWRALTYPLAPGPFWGWAAAMGASGVATPILERRTGPLGVAALAFIASAAGGAAFVALGGSGALAGAGPLALGLLGAWAVTSRERRVAAALSAVAVVGAPLADQDFARAAALAVSLAVGVAFGFLEGRIGGGAEGRAQRQLDDPPPIRW